MSAAGIPIAWTVAGSDSGGGAGIQADLKTFQGLGVHGCSVLTAVTAQSTLGIQAVDPVAPAILDAQCAALKEDLPPAAIKLGMLGTAESIRILVDHLREVGAPLVCDPVLASTSRTALLDEPGRRALREELLPLVDMLTPNLPETAALTGLPVESPEDIAAAADALLALGPRSVLITGGHREGPFCLDYFSDGRRSIWFASPRRHAAGSHGTGCVLSAAIAAGRALGWDRLDAVVMAKAYLNQALRMSLPIGRGDGPVWCGGMPDHPEDMPWAAPSEAEARHRPAFPPPETLPIGLYPVVDSLDWVRKLLPSRLRMLQLRIKDPHAPRLEADIAEAIRLAAGSATRLYINDHWQLALKYQAHGVHLGQDDLDPHAVAALAQAGIRLGISTHCPFEIARALACNPSYIALGTLFHTDSKPMDYTPLGLPAFTRLRKLIPCPTVAIGGIHLPHATAIRDAGADGQAVISEITHDPDPHATIQQWQATLRGHI